MKQKSYSQMRAIIERGESVIFGGNVINSLSALPSPAVIAQGDPSQAEAMAEEIRLRMATDQASLSALESITKNIATKGNGVSPFGTTADVKETGLGGAVESAPVSVNDLPSDNNDGGNELTAEQKQARDELKKAREEQKDAAPVDPVNL